MCSGLADAPRCCHRSIRSAPILCTWIREDQNLDRDLENRTTTVGCPPRLIALYTAGVGLGNRESDHYSAFRLHQSSPHDHVATQKWHESCSIEHLKIKHVRQGSVEEGMRDESCGLQPSRPAPVCSTMSISGHQHFDQHMDKAVITNNRSRCM